MNREQPLPMDVRMGIEEENPEAIAVKYIEQVSIEEREIIDVSQARALITTFNATINKDRDTMHTQDTMRKFQIVIGSKSSEEAKEHISEVAQDIHRVNETKFRSLRKSSLPDSVKSAILDINFKEGRRSAQELLQKMVDEKAEDADAVSRIINELSDKSYTEKAQAKKDKLDAEGIDVFEENDTYVAGQAIKMESDDFDQTRQLAVQKFLEGLYPDLIKKAGPLREFWAISFDDMGKPEVVAKLAKQYGEITGSDKYDEYTDAQALQEKLDKGSIGKFNLGNVIGNMSDELSDIIAEQVVSF